MSDFGGLDGADEAHAFIASKEAAWSDHTIRSYKQGLKYFLQWCADRGVHPLELRSIHFDILLREMVQKWAPGHVALRQTVVRGFYRYLLERDEISSMPIPDGWGIKVPHRPAIENLLSQSEIQALRRAAYADGDRSAVVFILIVDGLKKVGQVRDLNVEEIRFPDPGRVTIPGGDSPGSVYTDKDLTGEEADIIRRFVGDRSDGPLLHTHLGARITQQAVQHVLTRICKSAGIPRTIPRALLTSARAHTIGLHQGEFRPTRIRPVVDASRQQSDAVNPAAFAKELIALSDVLLDEPGVNPVAPVVLSGTALEHFLKRLALASGSTSGGGGIEAWAGALRSLGVISKREKKRIPYWSELRDAAVHADDDPPTFDDARTLNRELTEFVERHQSRVL